MSKRVRSREVYFVCDVCDKQFFGQSKDQINTIKYNQFLTKTELGKVKTLYNLKELMICNRCLEAMRRFIRYNVLDKHEPHEVSYDDNRDRKFY